jgi:hypothetical protein
MKKNRKVEQKGLENLVADELSSINFQYVSFNDEDCYTIMIFSHAMIAKGESNV